MLRLYPMLYAAVAATLAVVACGAAASSALHCDRSRSPIAPAMNEPTMLTLHLRSRAAAPGKEPVPPTERKVEWDPKNTAIIVCDMWDHHWCKSAEARVGELAGPMNEMLEEGPRPRRLRHPRPEHLHRLLQGHAATETRAKCALRADADSAGRVRTLGHGVELARREARGSSADRRFRHGVRLQGEVRDSRRRGRGKSPPSRSPRTTPSPTTARRRGTCSPSGRSTT